MGTVIGIHGRCLEQEYAESAKMQVMLPKWKKKPTGIY